MEDAALLPDKKRQLLNRSQSASQSTIWLRGESAANALWAPDSSRRHSTTTAEKYLLSVAKRDSDDASKYGVLTDDPFRSESRPGEGTVVTTKVLQTGMETRATTMQRTLTRDTWLRKTITDVAGIWISHTTSARSR